MSEGEHTGGCYGRGQRRLPKFIAFEVGLIKPCCLNPRKAAVNSIFNKKKADGNIKLLIFVGDISRNPPAAKFR